MCSSLTLPLIRIVTSDPVSRDDWAFVLSCKGWEVKTWGTFDEMIDEDDPRRRGCIVIDNADLLLFQSIASGLVQVPVILIDKASTIDAAVEAMKQGVKDYLCKPVDCDRLICAVTPWMQEDPSVERKELFQFEQNYRSLSVRERQVIHFSSWKFLRNGTVLLTSGTGAFLTMGQTQKNSQS